MDLQRYVVWKTFRKKTAGLKTDRQNEKAALMRGCLNGHQPTLPGMGTNGVGAVEAAG